MCLAYLEKASCKKLTPMQVWKISYFLEILSSIRSYMVCLFIRQIDNKYMAKDSSDLEAVKFSTIFKPTLLDK